MKPARARVITWRGRRITAYVPHSLASQTLDVREPTANKCTAATTRLLLASEMVPKDFASLAHLMARNEAIASSHIEGVRAPAIDSVLPAIDGLGRSVHDAIDTVRFVRDVATQELTVELLLEWHARLMTSGPLSPAHIGVLRSEQGWIGGTSPVDAALVTPPPNELPELIDDLIVFANRTDVDATLQAAVVHAQFELIHPFADGNGRVGRLLIDWVFCRRLNLVAPPSFSSAITDTTGAYLSGLTLFRMGDLDAWTAWFADVVVRSSQQQLALVQAVEELKAQWRARLLVRADATAWQVVGLIPRFPILTARMISAELNVSFRTALTALESLIESGILERHSRPIGKGRPAHLFVSPELLALVDVR